MTEHMDLVGAASWHTSPSSLEEVWGPIREAVHNRLIPGAAAAIQWKGKRIRYATGLSVDTDEEMLPVRYDTIYDCASLTKVVVTLPLVLMLMDQGKLQLEDHISNIVPEFTRNEAKAMTIRHLLTHTSGLASSGDFHSLPCTLDNLLHRLGSEPLSFEPGKQVVYSDLGFIVLGSIIARMMDMSIDQAAKRYIFDPLGMRDSCFCPPSDLLPRIAPTEMSQETGKHWRGIVHDENARALKGISGHAGLFSTADDLLQYAALWLNKGFVNNQCLISPATIATSIESQTRNLSSRRGLGWVLRGDQADVSGSLFSHETYGHTGFTGTSLYIDPKLNRAVVLLTNRVHYGRGHNITQLRSHFHDAAAAITNDI
ncbi:serine hydrolase [Cohnella sp. WQ 127256]|uniref:serine hydrolase domain-containing protein n=1 Tax=Cohnella sp. WQ 127256 TaxID=2938790 RepID=UPI00211876F8|nr:serine hydrolase domain-containing protein [Cohnella sp. WQ 127256]